jgi:hypothetical protein
MIKKAILMILLVFCISVTSVGDIEAACSCGAVYNQDLFNVCTDDWNCAQLTCAEAKDECLSACAGGTILDEECYDICLDAGTPEFMCIDQCTEVIGECVPSETLECMVEFNSCICKHWKLYIVCTDDTCGI